MVWQLVCWQSAYTNVPSAPEAAVKINGISDPYVATLMAEVTDTQTNGSETTYTVQADGFDIMNGGEKANIFKVTLNDSNEVVKVEAVEVNDTPTIGDKINDDAFFAQFAGVNAADLQWMQCLVRLIHQSQRCARF